MALSPPRVAPASITDDDGISVTNPAALSWLRQDRLVFGAPVGTLSQELVHLISQSATAEEALASTYTIPSRGNFKQIKDHLTKITTANKSSAEYMQAIKTCTEHLASILQVLPKYAIFPKIDKNCLNYYHVGSNF